MSEKLSRDESKTLLEALETTISPVQKVSALMGEKRFNNFVEVRREQKRLLSDNYLKDIQNFDGHYSAIYLNISIPFIVEYHEEANARFATLVQNNPELVTRFSAGTQSLILGKLVQEKIEVIDVEYFEISQKTAFEPITQAIAIAINGEKWKPKGDEARGPIYVSQVFYMVADIEFAFKCYDEAILYNAIRQANPAKYPKYHQNLNSYMLSQGKKVSQFNPFKKYTVEEKILKFLKKIYPKSINYLKLSEELEEDSQQINRQLGRSLKKGLVEKIERGVYRLKAISPHFSTTKGVD